MKKLQKVFKEWFRNNKNAEALMPKHCDML
jgi:hypothetical protein